MHGPLAKLTRMDTLKRELQRRTPQVAGKVGQASCPSPLSKTSAKERQAGCLSYLAAVLLLCCASLGLGCRQNAGEAAGHSDANGYVCRACKAKFFTKRSVFAARCPSCRSVDLAPVVGFLCDKDGHTTLTTSRDDPVTCEQCQTRLANIRLPHEKELRAWGAEQKNKKDVMP